MAQQDNTTRSAVRQERKFRRFDLSYPVHVEFRSAKLVSGLDALSRNVSAAGLLLDAPSLIPQGTPARFTMSVRGSHIGQSAELSGRGRVVRIEPRAPETGFCVAVKCTTPIHPTKPHSRP